MIEATVKPVWQKIQSLVMQAPMRSATRGGWCSRWRWCWWRSGGGDGEQSAVPDRGGDGVDADGVGLISKLSLAGLELDLVLPEHMAARRTLAGRIYIRNSKRWLPSFSVHLSGSEESVLTTLYFPVIREARC